MILNRGSTKNVKKMNSSKTCSDKNNIRYVVDARLGYCACVSGKMGGFCKHQFLLMEHLNLKMQNAPCTCALDRLCIGKTALGDSCPTLQYFEEFVSTPPNIIITDPEIAIDIPVSEQSNSDAIPDTAVPLPLTRRKLHQKKNFWQKLIEFCL